MDNNTLENRWLELSVDIFELFRVKNAKYTPDNISQIGVNGVVFMMTNKFSRLRNLLLNGVAPTADETVKDTLMDIVNYSLILMMLLEGSWPIYEGAQSYVCPCCGRK